jgi:allantoin racemase
MSFRLTVINPNSDQAITAHLREASARVLPPDSVVSAVDCPDGPRVIETALDSVLAAPRVVAAAARAGDTDGFVVGCFGGPAAAALRELSAAPVVGLGTAALVEASIVTARFGVITTLERGIPALWAQLDDAGVARACAGIRSVEAAANVEPGTAARDELETAASDDGAQEDDGAGDNDLLARLTGQGRLLLADGADGLVLACAGFARCSERLAARLDVPVCDGIGPAASLAHGLWASGVQTSKRGGYAYPPRDVLDALADRAAAALAPADARAADGGRDHEGGS